MIDNSALIKKLNTELSSVNDYTREDVFNAFEKYIDNKAKLRKAIDLGLLYYDYAKFKTSFEGTLFEDGLSVIIALYNNALKQNHQASIQICKDSYPYIAHGFASRTQMLMTSGNSNFPDRLDLFAKVAFQLIGDGVENSLKPFLEFLNAVCCISRNKPIVKKKLGVIVDNLMSNNELLKALYKTLFLDISVSQWRNISNHGSYSCTTDGKIEIHYGENNMVTECIDRQDLESILATLDTLLYMHKTAYTLICIEHIDKLPVLKKYQETSYDDLIMQIVETSYAYGLEAFVIEKQNWKIAVEKKKEELTHDDLEQYCSAIAAILSGKRFNILIYNRTQVQYQIAYNQRQAPIYRYVARNKKLCRGDT